MKHKAGQRIHALNRIFERLGVNLTHEEYLTLCEECGDRSKTRFISFTPSQRQIIEVKKYGFRFDVIYDPKFRRVVTILPSSIVNLSLGSLTQNFVNSSNPTV